MYGSRGFESVAIWCPDQMAHGGTFNLCRPQPIPRINSRRVSTIASTTSKISAFTITTPTKEPPAFLWLSGFRRQHSGIRHDRGPALSAIQSQPHLDHHQRPRQRVPLHLHARRSVDLPASAKHRSGHSFCSGQRCRLLFQWHLRLLGREYGYRRIRGARRQSWHHPGSARRPTPAFPLST